ncbi:MAG TPA: DMT family transporter [Bacteroidales bacterium]|nr:DMT family transporter [Bacteroidales bacterium]
MNKAGKIFLANKGIVFMIVASLFFAIMGASVKVLSRNLDSIQIVFFRNIFGTLFILLSMTRRPLKNRGGRPLLLIFRGLAGTLALYALFYNMSTIGLGISMTFLQTSPIFVAVFSLFFLHEKLSVRGWISIFIGFAGILLVFQPGGGLDFRSSMLGLFNGIAAGAAYTSVRELRKYYDARSIVLSFMTAGILLPVISIIVGEVSGIHGMDYLFSDFKFPSGIQWIWAIMVGITALLGQLSVTRAYAEESAGIVAAVGYVTIPFSIIIGTVLGDDWPGLISIAGIALIIVSGILISFRSNRSKHKIS